MMQSESSSQNRQRNLPPQGFEDRFGDMVSLLCWRAENHPEAMAFRFFPDGEHQSTALSYGEMHHRAQAIAARLQAEGCVGERLLIFYPPGLDFITAFVGCLYAKAIPVPAYSPEPNRLAHTLQRLRSIVQDAQASGILTDSGTLALAQNLMARGQETGLPPLRWFQTDRLDQLEQLDQTELANDWKRPSYQASELAFLQYTSGSTARPKGVMISHGNLLANHQMIQTACEHREREVKLACWVPFHHDLGLVFHLLYSLYIGGETLVLPPLVFIRNPFSWLKLISDHRATGGGGPNFAYDLCVRRVSPEQRDQLDLSSWTLAVNGAEPISAATAERFIAYFTPCGFQRSAYYPSYGMAESTIFMAGTAKAKRPYSLNVDRQALDQMRVEAGAPGPNSLTLMSSGQAWLDEKICIVDPQNLQELGADRVGEIWIQGRQVAQGYWQQPEATQESFRAQLAGHEGFFLRTGDLGFLHEQELFVTGRRKDLIIVHGRNLYPQDLERSVDALRATEPAIRPGCGVAFGWSHQSAGGTQEQVVFVQEITPEKALEDAVENAVEKHLGAQIADTLAREHEVAVHAVVLVQPGTLPKTSSGKLMRQACKQAYAQNFEHSPIQVLGVWSPTGAGATAGVPRAPDTGLENALQNWLLDWLARECELPREQISPQQRFQALGVDSVLAVRLVADLEAAWGYALPETLLWEQPSPQALLEYLKQGYFKQGDLSPKSSAPQSLAAAAAQSHAESSAPEPIAVIGMACRFPGGANTPEAFWELLRTGRDAIGSIPAERWDVDASYAPQKGQPGKTYVREGGFLEDVAGFDPAFFQLSPREALGMDPQQRLLLELAWEALENAGVVATELAESLTGVFIGLSNIDYSQHNLFSGQPERIDAYAGTGNAPSVAAGRLAYWLGLQGPAFALDTACSSSLVAVHQACQSLRLGECELALAGGVNLILGPELNIYFSQLQALAADGRCKSFDAAADGFVRSEGGGLVVLKPLSAAQRDGDPILGLIRASAINHDGHSNGLTAPNGRAQVRLLQAALHAAQLPPEAISFVEAHGTGTPLGDPIEIRALSEVLLTPTRDQTQQPLWVGAVKSNLGHLEAAAGVAGLIKILLAFQHRALPANVHFQQPNPRLPQHPLLRYPTELIPWQSQTERRLAGLSSFGISGTNAHLILEAPPDPARPPAVADTDEAQWLSLSAHSLEALRARLQQMQAWLHTHPELCLRDLSHTSLLRRAQLRYRWATRVNSLESLQQQIQAALEATEEFRPALTPPLNFPRVAFVFPGQGSQWLGMGQELLEREPVFRTALLRCEQALAAEVDWKLTEILAAAKPEDFERMALIQPLLFALQVGLARLWQARGVQPQVVIGHSMGEVAAAHIAGALSLEDAVHVICQRSRLLAQQEASGAMLLTGLSASASEKLLREYTDLSIGAYNSPYSTVLSGSAAELETVQTQLKAEEIFARFVRVSVASHSPQVEPLASELRQQLSHLKPRSTQVPLFSTVRSQPQNPSQPLKISGPELDAQYWFENLRQPVRFTQAVSAAQTEGIQVWIEISPHPILLNMIQETLSATPQESTPLLLASTRRQQPEQMVLDQSLLHYFAAGGELPWRQVLHASGADKARLLLLPPYPWQRQPYWLKRPQAAPPERPESQPQRAVVPNRLWQLRWQARPLPQQRPMPRGRWLLLANDPDLILTLQFLLEAQRQEVTVVKPQSQPQNLAEELTKSGAQGTNALPLNGVICAWNAALPPFASSGDSTFRPDKAEAAAQRLLLLLQALASLPPTPAQKTSPRLYVVSHQTITPPESPDQPLNLAEAPLWGLSRSALYELPRWQCTQIDLSARPSALEIQLLFNEVLAQSPETNVVLRGAQRWVARMAAYQAERKEPTTPCPTSAPELDHTQEETPKPPLSLGQRLRKALWSATPPSKAPLARTTPTQTASQTQTPRKPAANAKIQAEASYLITGGLGALGLHTARWLVAQGARHLILLGRKGLSRPEQEAALTALRQQAASTTESALLELQIHAVDVSDFKALKQALNSLRPQMPPLKGIFHAAGVLADGRLATQTPAQISERLHAVLAPKVAGAWNLHQLTQADDLDLFVCYASLTGVLGGPGQANYAAANAFLDVLMQSRRARGLAALSIDWGPWAEGGLAVSASQKQGRPHLRQYGLQWIDPQEGLNFLAQLLQAQTSAACVMGLDLPRFWQAFPPLRDWPLLQFLAQEETVHLPPRQNKPTSQRRRKPSNSDFKPPLGGPAVPRPDEASLERFCSEAIVRMLNLAPGSLERQTPLRNYGFDSLMALELQHQLEQSYGLRLPPSENIQTLNLQELCQTLSAESASQS